MSESLHLFRLQQVDRQHDLLQKRNLELERLISNNSEVQKAEHAAETAQALQKKVANEIKQVEESITQKKIKTEQSESALYGGKVTNSKELQDLQTEIAILKKSISSLEDDLLAKMIDLEKANSELSNSQISIETARARFSENNANLLGERTQNQVKLDKLVSERNVITAQIDPVKIGTYENLRVKKNGIAVAEIVDNECNICGSKLTQAEWQAARAPSGLVFCSNCGRILYAA